MKTHDKKIRSAGVPPAAAPLAGNALLPFRSAGVPPAAAPLVGNALNISQSPRRRSRCGPEGRAPARVRTGCFLTILLLAGNALLPFRSAGVPPAAAPLVGNALNISQSPRRRSRCGPEGRAPGRARTGFFLAILLNLLLPFTAQAALNVVTTTPEFAAIAREVGGDFIKVTSLAKGTEDPHFVDPKPSFIRLLNKADVLVEGGADLEVGWLPPLVENARNGKILAGEPGRIVMSRGLRLLEVADGAIDRSQGDVHAAGNPHFSLDPANGKIMGATLADAFTRLDPAHAAQFAAQFASFNERLDQKLAAWAKLMEPWRGTKVLTYHKSYEYFAARFGLEIVGQIEPKPGIEPSPNHISSLLSRLQGQSVKLVLMEPNRSRKTPEFVAHALGARVAVLPILVGGADQASDYFALFDYNLGAVIAGLKPQP